MPIITRVSELRRVLEGVSRPIGVVPTMGNLHEGHLSLVHAAQRECPFVVATIFVNPMQFGPQEDFASYPRMLKEDASKLNAIGVKCVFAPGLDEVYPDGQDLQTVVSVPSLGDGLCGSHRPGHFDGVTTVVAKLLNMVQPDVAFFGEKDWQQLTIIRQMVRQLNMPVQIRGEPTVRDGEGLALSSRNQYLTTEERRVAPILYQTLMLIADSISNGNTRFTELEDDGSRRLAMAGFRPDYCAIRNAVNLQPPSAGAPLRVFAAAYLGQARLIDNVAVQR